MQKSQIPNLADGQQQSNARNKGPNANLSAPSSQEHILQAKKTEGAIVKKSSAKQTAPIFNKTSQKTSFAPLTAKTTLSKTKRDKMIAQKSVTAEEFV